MSELQQQDGKLEVHHRTVLDDETRHVARIYADALYRAAESSGQVDQVLGEIESLVKDIFAADPGMELFFASAAVGRDRKVQALGAFKGQASQTFQNFLGVLNEHDRLGMLRPIATAFRTLVNQKRHRVVVQVTSAIPLSDDERARIIGQVKSLSNFEPELRETIDAEILGGLIVRIGDWVYDASVRSQLQTIRQQLIERSSHGIQSGRDRFSNLS